MAVILALLWFFGTIASLWFVARPSEKLPPFASRKRSAISAVVVFLGVPILSAATGIGAPNNVSAPAAEAAAPGTDDQTPAKLAADMPPKEPHAADGATPGYWSYDESRDEMRNTTTSYARTMSDESFENSLGFGDEKTRLEIQKHAKGYDVDISNSNLQFTCNSFSGTHVSVKFDDGPVERFGCTDSVGNKYGVAFINAGDRFVSKLRRAKRVTIEAEVFQRGDTQMSFDVAGLNF